MNFGKAIVLSFVLFALFIGTLVTVCVRQEVSLVSPDYYRLELEHGSKMKAMANAEALAVRPEISVNASNVIVAWNELGRISEGSLTVMRPSDQDLDRRFNINGASGTEMAFPLPAADHGLYRAQLAWKMDGRDYLIEKVIIP
ncbi:MAG: FixH family protein [Bacteroidota bacterium]